MNNNISSLKLSKSLTLAEYYVFFSLKGSDLKIQQAQDLLNKIDSKTSQKMQRVILFPNELDDAQVLSWSQHKIQWRKLLNPFDLDKTVKHVFNNIFKIEKTIGQGSFAHIYEVSVRDCPAKKTALKVSKVVLRENELKEQEFNLQKTILRAVVLDKEKLFYKKINASKDPNKNLFLNCHENYYFWSGLSFCSAICLDLAKTSLEIYRENLKEKISLQDIQKISKDLFKGLGTLKNLNIIHNDLRADNILITSFDPLTIKITDFGASFLFPRESNEFTLLPYYTYRAPEIVFGHENISYPVDIWAVGCTLYFLYTGKEKFTPLSDLTEKDIDKILIKHLKPPPKSFLKKCIKKPSLKEGEETIPSVRINPSEKDTKLFEHFKDLLDKIFVWDPDKRITPEQALKHPFFLNQETIVPSKSLSSCTSSSRSYSS